MGTVRKIFSVLSIVFGITVFSGTAHAALPAPYDLQAQWGVNGTGLHNQNLQFHYDPSSISQVKAFRLYHKRPGASTFSIVATFNNPVSIYSECSSQTESAGKSITVGSWSLTHFCAPAHWEFHHGLLEPASAFPVGQYDFSIAVLDASGAEAVVSPVASQYVLEQTKILSPSPADSPSSVAMLRWIVPSGWPRDFAHYVIEIFEGTPAGQGPLYVEGIDVNQANTIGEFSLNYNGPKLSQDKMYTFLIQEGSDVIQRESPSPKNPDGSPYRSYISMNAPVEIEALPQASNISVRQITDTSAHILWNTNIPAISSIDYRKTLAGGAGGAVTAWTSTLNTSHDTVLKNLAPSTTYYFSIRLKNALQGETQTEFSEKNLFATLAPPIPPPSPPPPSPPSFSPLSQPILSSPPPTQKSAPAQAFVPAVKSTPVQPIPVEPKAEKQIEQLSPVDVEETTPQVSPQKPQSGQTRPQGFFSRMLRAIFSLFRK